MKRAMGISFAAGLGVGLMLWALALPNTFALEDRIERLIKDKAALRHRFEAVSDVCRGAIELGTQR